MKFNKIITLLTIIITASTVVACGKKNKHTENIKEAITNAYDESKALAGEKKDEFVNELEQFVTKAQNKGKNGVAELKTRANKLRENGQEKLAAFLEKQAKKLEKK